jgi:hypothetical protein
MPAQRLGQPQPFTDVFPQGCTGQVCILWASLTPFSIAQATAGLVLPDGGSRCDGGADGGAGVAPRVAGRERRRHSLSRPRAPSRRRLGGISLPHLPSPGTTGYLGWVQAALVWPCRAMCKVVHVEQSRSTYTQYFGPTIHIRILQLYDVHAYGTPCTFHMTFHHAFHHQGEFWKILTPSTKFSTRVQYSSTICTEFSSRRPAPPENHTY